MNEKAEIFSIKDRVRHKWFGVGGVVRCDREKKTIDVDFGSQIIKDLSENDSLIELLPESLHQRKVAEVKLRSETGMDSITQQHFDKAVGFFDRDENCEIENFPIAVNELKFVLNTEPKFAPAHYYIALAYANLHQFDDAIIHLDLVPYFSPSSELAAMAHEKLALLYDHLKKPTEALSHLERGIAIRPYHAQLHYLLGCILAYDLNKIGKGVSEIQEAVDLKPNSEEYRLGLKAAYKKLLQDAQTKPVPVPLEVAMRAFEELSQDIMAEEYAANPDWELASIKLEVFRLVAVASRAHVKTHAQKVGGVIGGVLGLFGGPLVAAGSAAIGATVAGSIGDDTAKWEPLMFQLEMLQGVAKKMLQVASSTGAI
jgi:tetratricopeptide (TPR) repeat protein